MKSDILSLLKSVESERGFFEKERDPFVDSFVKEM